MRPTSPQGSSASCARRSAKIQGIGDDRGYGYHASIHGLPFPISCGIAHGRVLFLPWHRAYLYFFERALRDQVPDAMLSWWDWRVGPNRPARIPRVFDEAQAGGQPNPLASADVPPLAIQQGGNRMAARTARRPGRPGTSLPSVAEIEAVLNIRNFAGFSEQLETLHGGVHMWVGGHMGTIEYSAFDPIFWAHHTMIDRLWRVWELRHSGARPPDSLLDQALPPFPMTVRQTLSVTALGYDYAVASASTRVPA